VQSFFSQFSQVFYLIVDLHIDCIDHVDLNVAVGRSLVSSGVVHVDNYIIQVSSFWHITYTIEHCDISAYKHGRLLRYK